MIDTAAFREQLESDGFTIGEVEWQAGTENPTHTHPFSARLMCLSGSVTIETPDGKTTCTPGDTIAVDANVPHAEWVGEQGVRLMVGRKES